MHLCGITVRALHSNGLAAPPHELGAGEFLLSGVVLPQCSIADRPCVLIRTAADRSAKLGRGGCGETETHERRRRCLSDDLAQRRRLVGRDHRPNPLSPSVRNGHAAHRGRSCPRDQRHVGSRRAVDRRHGGLRIMSRDARRQWRRCPGPSLRPAAGDAAHGGESALGAGRYARSAAQYAGGRPGCRSLPPGRRNLRRRRRDLPGDRRPRAGDHPRSGSTQDRRAAGQCADPLQCRLAGHGGLGHGDGADLQGLRCGGPGACLGRRDTAAQPRRIAYGLGAGAPRR